MENIEKYTILEKRNTLKTIDGVKCESNSEEQSKVKIKREDELDCLEPVDTIEKEKNSMQLPKVKIEKLDELEYFDSTNQCGSNEELEVIGIKNELLSEEFDVPFKYELSERASDEECRAAQSTQNFISKETKEIRRKPNILSTTSRDGHLYLKSKEVCFQCCLCGRVFLRPLDFYLFHLLTYHSGETFLKSIIINKRRHLDGPPTNTNTIENNRSKFTICPKSFFYINKRKRHLCCHNNENGKCDICYKQCNKSPNLTTQIQSHRGKKLFKCEICFIQCYSKSNFKSHMRSHTGKKLFKCDICLKQFSVKHLKIHMRCHTGEKPFKCEICSRHFNQKGHLTTHMRTHTGEKHFKCEICSKQFHHKYSLTIHMCHHTGVKPFKCEICLKQFNQKGHLTTHIRSHTGEKPFKCEICSKQFCGKSLLTRHMRCHGNEKPFKCENFSK